MSELERKVWDAICAAMNEGGDGDVRAGIGWWEDGIATGDEKSIATAQKVARAAIEAVK